VAALRADALVALVTGGAGWTLRTNPTTGHATLNSPTGHRYDVEPEDHRRVVAADDAPETLAAKERLDPCPF
jgi:hypothetical protein